MRKISAALIGLFVSIAIEPIIGADPPACPSTTNSQYDYIVVGAGAGGGPLAARLALNGYKVLLLEAGPDSYQNNVTIPFYFGRTTEDEKLALDYEVDHYTSPNNVTAWYPRSQGIGGSTIHNALIHMRAQNWDFDNIADITGDSSWKSSSMQKYLTRLEKNLYVPKQAGESLDYGYDGWLSTNSGPLNLINDPKYADEQIGTIMSTLMSSVPAVGGSDWNNLTSDGVAGSAMLTFTRDQYGNRSSTRDHLVDVRTRLPDKLTIQTETMATRILICKSSDGSLQAYGVEAASGPYLLPVARQFSGKRTLDLKTYTAKYELSGIGPSQQLSKFGISTLVDLPGQVGENVQDRMEATLVWKLNHTHKIFSLGCLFGDDPKTDPCLADWIATNHTNVYSLGAALWGEKFKSNSSLSHLDVLSIWGPGAFTHYYRGFGRDYGLNSPDSINNAFLKAYARSKGWVRLTGSDPQDKLEINKNYLGSPESIEDLTIIRDSIQKSRRYIASTPQINRWIVQETWPGSQYQTDEQLWEFLRANVFGHHLCCSAKIGADNDSMAVLDSQFQLRGVKNLRVVDASAFPVIPGMFITTPIYTISEKAADLILDTAKTNGWGTGSAAVTSNSNSGIGVKGAVPFVTATLIGMACLIMHM
ncbi:Aryl-alcohol oxidase, partial [Rhizoctonia solani]